MFSKVKTEERPHRITVFRNTNVFRHNRSDENATQSQILKLLPV